MWIKLVCVGYLPTLLKSMEVGISPAVPVLSLLMLCQLEPATSPPTSPV